MLFNGFEVQCRAFTFEFRSWKEKLFDILDYVIYHMPFSNMAKKAHRCLVEAEYHDLDSESRERIYKESFHKMVEGSLLGAREVGNIYTGSVYMGLMSLLEQEKEKVEGKKVGIFSYGSGCGAEFFICDMKSNLKNIIDRLDFMKQLERRKKITIDHYTHIYSKKDEEVIYFSPEVQNYKDHLLNLFLKG